MSIKYDFPIHEKIDPTNQKPVKYISMATNADIEKISTIDRSKFVSRGGKNYIYNNNNQILSDNINKIFEIYAESNPYIETKSSEWCGDMYKNISIKMKQYKHDRTFPDYYNEDDVFMDENMLESVIIKAGTSAFKSLLTYTTDLNKKTKVYNMPGRGKRQDTAIYTGELTNVVWLSSPKTAFRYWRKYTGGFCHYRVNQDIKLFLNSDKNIKAILNLLGLIKDALILNDFEKSIHNYSILLIKNLPNLPKSYNYTRPGIDTTKYLPYLAGYHFLNPEHENWYYVMIDKFMQSINAYSLEYINKVIESINNLYPFDDDNLRYKQMAKTQHGNISLFKEIDTEGDKIYGYYKYPFIGSIAAREVIVNDFLIRQYGFCGTLYPRSMVLTLSKPSHEAIAIGSQYVDVDLNSEYTWLNWGLDINKLSPPEYPEFAFNYQKFNSANYNFKYNEMYIRGYENFLSIINKPPIAADENKISIFSLNVHFMNSINIIYNVENIISEFKKVINYQNADICVFQEAPIGLITKIFTEPEFKKIYKYSIFCANGSKSDSTSTGDDYMGIFVVFKESPANMGIVPYKYVNANNSIYKHRDYIICRYKNISIAFCHIEIYAPLTQYNDYYLIPQFTKALNDKERGQTEALKHIINNLKQSENAVIIGDMNFMPLENQYKFMGANGFHTMETDATTVHHTICDYGWVRGISKFDVNVYKYHHSDHNGIRMEVDINTFKPPLPITYDLKPQHVRKPQIYLTTGGTEAGINNIVYYYCIFIVLFIIILFLSTRHILTHTTREYIKKN